MNSPAIRLSPQQDTAMVDLSGTQDYYCLKGYAGTGKTTVITYWIKEKKPKGKIVLTAPTNKAANVLRDKAREIRLPVDVRTIHSLLALKMQWQEDKQVLVPDNKGEDKFGDYAWVVVDECSMLNKELMAFICRAREFHKNKVIFMGDPCQLPPIGEKGSKAFDPPSQSELTDVMRQAKDSNILSLSIYLRKLILSERPSYPAKLFEFVDDKSVFYHPVSKYEEDILKAFVDAEDNKDIRHLAWTNAVVNTWNNRIRDRIYGFDREEWTEGEQIVTTSPVIDPYEGGILFTTDTLLEIEEEPVLTEREDVECWQLICKDQPLYVVTDTGQRQFLLTKKLKLAEAKADKKKWRDFYTFMETFSSVKPAHSLTVHRSQGSTFDDVYVSFANILANPNRKESLQCLYVAVTRPRSKLYLI